MFFKKAIERSFIKRQEEGRKEISKMSAEEFEEEVKSYKENVELEKGDLPAMMIGAIIAFGPILLFFLALIVLMLIFW